MRERAQLSPTLWLVPWMVGAVVLSMSRSAWAAIAQVVTGPLDGDPAGDTLFVGTKVTSSFAITKVTVTILGVTTPVTLRGGGWRRARARRANR